MMTRAAKCCQQKPELPTSQIWSSVTDSNGYQNCNATKSSSAELKAAAEHLWRRSTYMLSLYRTELFYRKWWLTSHSLWYFYPLSLEYMETRAGQWVCTALVFILHQKLS